MKKTSLPLLIVLLSLVTVIGIAVLTFQRTIQVEGSNRAMPVGIGDLKLYESKPVLPDTSGTDAQVKNHPAVVGVGDLRLYEASQADAQPAGQRPQTIPNEGISFEK